MNGIARMSSACGPAVRVIFQELRHLDSIRFGLASLQLKGPATMQSTRTPVLAAVALASSFLATAAFASGYNHTANTDMGYKAQTEHFQSDTTRAQVQKEAAAALTMSNNAAYPVGSHDSGQPHAHDGKHHGEHAQGLTREQVNTQYLNESPAQRKARDELFRG